MGSACGKEPNDASEDTQPILPNQTPPANPQREIRYAEHGTLKASPKREVNLSGNPLAPASHTNHDQPMAAVVPRRRNLMRTVSTIHEEEYIQLRKEYPGVVSLFPKIDKVKMALKTQMEKIHEEEDDHDSGVSEIYKKLDDVIIKKFDKFKENGERKLMGDYMTSIE